MDTPGWLSLRVSYCRDCPGGWVTFFGKKKGKRHSKTHEKRVPCVHCTICPHPDGHRTRWVCGSGPGPRPPRPAPVDPRQGPPLRASSFSGIAEPLPPASGFLQRFPFSFPCSRAFTQGLFFFHGPSLFCLEASKCP